MTGLLQRRKLPRVIGFDWIVRELQLGQDAVAVVDVGPAQRLAVDRNDSLAVLAGQFGGI